MKPRKEVYRKKHRIRPENTYNKKIKKPQVEPEGDPMEEYEEYDDPRKDQKSLSEFLEELGMSKKKEEKKVDPTPQQWKDIVDRLSAAVNAQTAAHQLLILGLMHKVIVTVEEGSSEDIHLLAQEFKDYTDRIEGRYETKN